MNPDVRAAGARVQQAEAQVGQSRMWQNPTLDLGVNNITVGRFNRTGLPANYSRADTISYSVGLSQTIELGKRGPRVEAARLHRDASSEEYRSTLLDLLSDARAAMTKVAYLGARQHILEDGLVSAQSMADLTKIRLDRGDVSGVDQARLLLDVDRVRRDVADNQSDLEDALADCSALLFAPCQADAATLDVAEKSAGAANYDSVDQAIAGRPDLRALRLEQRAAASEATMHRRSAIPDPTVGVTYTRDYYEAAGNQPYTVGVSASIPLPFFDHGQYQAIEADHRAEELAATLQSSERHAISDARSLVIRRRVLQNKLDNIQRAALPRSKEVVDSTTVAYQRGQISLTDLLIARREHAALLLEEADTRFALFNIENDLRRALGIDQDLVGQKPREDS
ncbi:MAG TPA: TolC family protein [Polyangiaceae bacterium]|jgi:cobalt-zinc-cadmium efflux system outer membrane protein|nr:TolC family protein [Polyangiaceae bacterium]